MDTNTNKAEPNATEILTASGFEVRQAAQYAGTCCACGQRRASGDLRLVRAPARTIPGIGTYRAGAWQALCRTKACARLLVGATASVDGCDALDAEDRAAIAMGHTR